MKKEKEKKKEQHQQSTPSSSCSGAAGRVERRDGGWMLEVGRHCEKMLEKTVRV
jgi:hypothetical protein